MADTDTDHRAHLSDQQKARIEALMAARSLLVQRSLAGSGEAKPGQLIELASWIMVGSRGDGS